MFIDTDTNGEPTGWHPWHFIGAFALIAAVLYGAGWLALGERVMTAGIRGQAAAHIQKESAENRVASQRRFAVDLADIVKFNQQYDDALRAVTSFEAANAGRPDNALGTLATQRANLVQTATGIQQQCQNTIADYAAAGASYLSAEFKSAGFPDTISVKEFCQGRPVPSYPAIGE